MLSDHILLEKNQRGLVHAPDESADAFILRCQNAQKKDSADQSKLAKNLFDINPDWIQIYYDNRRLRLWEGACTWIEAHQVTLQLRKTFEKKTHYLGYSREEILAHELVHMVRSGFEEPIFEEILAYQTSPSFIRRFLGPIFRSSKESLIFVIALSLTFVCMLFATFQSFAYLSILGLVFGGIFRLFRAQWIFSRARKKIVQIVGKKKTLAVMVRLTDREIIRFSKMQKEQIVSYAIKMSRTQLRWRQIRLAYIKN